MTLADLPLFAPHSEPQPKRKHRRTGPVTFRTKRPSYCSALRAFMCDGEWKDYWDLVKVGGARFPARLWDIAEGLDGGRPTPYEVKRDEADHTKTAYRLKVGP